MRYDPKLTDKNFQEKLNNLKRNIGKEYEKDFDDLIHIITNEKILHFEYKRALEKIEIIENILKSKGKKLPLILLYRKAAILYESNDKKVKNLAEANDLFKSLLNERDQNLKFRAIYYLCRINLDFAKQYELEDEIDEYYTHLEQVNEFFDFLKGHAEDGKLDETILSWLWELKERIEELRNEQKYIVFFFKNSPQYFKNLEEAENYTKNIKNIIYYPQKYVKVNGEKKELSDNIFEDLIKFSKGAKSTDFRKENEVKETVYKRLQRLKDSIKELGISLSPKRGKYSLDIDEKIALICPKEDYESFSEYYL